METDVVTDVVTNVETVTETDVVTNVETIVDKENDKEEIILFNNSPNNFVMSHRDVIEDDKPKAFGPEIIITDEKTHIKKKKYCDMKKESSCLII